MKKSVLVAAVVSLAIASLWSVRRSSEPVAGDRHLVLDRIWIDHVPAGERDTVQVFVALREQAIGVFQATSAWKGSFEAFRYEASGADLRIVYPQTGAREAVRARARRCTEKQMDYCLELDGASRGVKRYYSREGWEIDRARSVEAAIRQADALRGRLAAAP